MQKQYTHIATQYIMPGVMLIRLLFRKGIQMQSEWRLTKLLLQKETVTFTAYMCGWVDSRHLVLSAVPEVKYKTYFCHVQLTEKFIMLIQ